MSHTKSGSLECVLQAKRREEEHRKPVIHALEVKEVYSTRVGSVKGPHKCENSNDGREGWYLTT